MKKTNLLKCLASLSVFAILLHSCKKSDVNQEITPENQSKQNINVPKEILDEVKSTGRTYTLYMNVPTKGYAGDANGDPIIKPGQVAPGQRQGSRTLSTDPAVCADPDSYVDNASITSVEITYVCGSGYQLKVTWRISSYFTLLTANPANSSQLSKGRIQLKNSGGINVYQNTTITPVTITTIGADPGDPSATLYDFSYTTPFISASDMNSSVTINNAWLIYTDCGGGNNRTTPYLSTNAWNTTAITTPCARVDLVQVIPQQPASGYNGYVSGSDPAFSCGDTYIHNTTSEIRYRAQGTTTWNALTMYEAGTGTPRSGYIYFWEVLYLNLPSGTYEFQWWNTYNNPDQCGSSAPKSVILTRTF